MILPAIINLSLLYAVVAKPFLGNFLIQVATSLSSLTPDDPNSHVSDFRSQPHTDHSEDDLSKALKDESENSTHSESTTVVPEESMVDLPKNSIKLQILPWQKNGNNTIEMFSELVGNIIGSAREHISAGFQRLLTPLRQRRQGYLHSLPLSLRFVMSKKDHETTEPETIGVDGNMKKNVNQKTGSIKSDLQIEDVSSEPRVSYQLDKKSTIETSAPVNKTRSLRRFFLKRLDRFAERFNETQKQFRARTIRVVGTLIPLLLLAEETRSRGMANSLGIDLTNVSWGYFNSDDKSLRNKFTLPHQLSRVSNNLLSLNADRSERAILALQNAFFKYAKLIINGTNTLAADNITTFSDFTTNVKNEEEKESVSFNSAARRFNVRNMETIGILILEMFGSIAGLTWGALQQLQKYFQ